MKIQPFNIAISDSALVDLRDRLARTRWQTTISNSAWDEGTDIDFLTHLVAYWRDKAKYLAALQGVCSERKYSLHPPTWPRAGTLSADFNAWLAWVFH
jgi:hypothetical protein